MHQRTQDRGEPEDHSRREGGTETDDDRPQELDPGRRPDVRNGHTLNENEPNPVRLSSPTKINAPIPAASRPGNQDHSIIGPPNPAISIKEGADERRAQERGNGGEAPRDTDHHHGHRRCIPLEQVHGEDAEPTPDGDQRRLRAHDRAQAERGEGRHNNAEELDRRAPVRRP